MTALGSSPSFIISNSSNLVSTKLDRHNYLLWHSKFEPLLLSHDLMGFVYGSNPCPEKFLRDKNEKLTINVNPAFQTWTRQDRNLLSWIRATLSEHVLSQVVSLCASRDVWTAIEQCFASLSHAHIIKLKGQLQNLQKGNLSITDYLQNHKTIVDELCANGHFIDESDQVTHILDGPPKKYDHIDECCYNKSKCVVLVADVHGKMRLFQSPMFMAFSLIWKCDFLIIGPSPL